MKNNLGKSCPLVTDVQYTSCKDADGKKFNGGKIKSKNDYIKWKDGIPGK